MKKTCETCAFFYLIHQIDIVLLEAVGENSDCRRYPKPEKVNRDYWCGEWRKKEDEGDDQD